MFFSFVKERVKWGIMPIIGEFPYQVWAGFFKSILAARLMGWLLNDKIPPHIISTPVL
jgi:hypothetical protein